MYSTDYGYVRDTSYDVFSGRDELRFKTWRARDGEWFEGCYVFVTSDARDSFETSFRAGADESPGSRIVESGPVLIEPCEIVAVAEGAEKFLPAAAY